MSQIAPYGSWRSPVGPADVARSETHVTWLDFVGEELWWVELRTAEGGRSALLRRAADGRVGEVLPPEWNVRSRVHEYGGRPWCATPDGVVFVHWPDQRLYHHDRHGRRTRPLSPPPPRPAGWRHADLSLSADGAEVWCVREELTGPAPTDVRRALVAIPLDGSAAGSPAAVRELTASHHFLTGPKLAPEGRSVAWIGWNHPAMPWEATELLVAEVTPAGTFGRARVLAGGPAESVVQVEWADADSLHVLGDRGGWWNLRQVPLDGAPARELCPRAEEFGGAPWQLGLRWFTRLADGRLAVLHGAGRLALGLLDPISGALSDVDGPYTEWSPVLATDGVRIAGVAGGPRQAREIVLTDAADGSPRRVRPEPVIVPAHCVPRPEQWTCREPDGPEVHAYVYPPHHEDFTGPPGERPPYVIFAHGGPTSRSAPVLDPEIAYFTSRGLGVADVQYGGSTGFGRQYRERLRHQWGVVDVADCATVARTLIGRGLADPARLAIRGRSSGGWTAISSLISTELYRCGAIYFPILDPVGWRTGETHDFESHYPDSLIGPWPRTRHRYQQRSPVRQASRITAPFALFQGLEDVICPPEQCARLLAALDGRGVPHAYLTFAGEQHGFRRAASITAAFAAELSLYGQVFGFDPPDTPRLPLST
ncbi:prolyl oligopeptidase family serine peptidase [Crossiella sp. CA198]|uniref:prolyl oligopeptidase family serine peptidase n=1 Tax=Crossiella sp. CA198 TaxID=3455607 RepID=UPI003F8D131A